MADYEDHLVQPTLEPIPNDYQNMDVNMSIDSTRLGRKTVPRPDMPWEDWQIDAYIRTVNYLQLAGKADVSQKDQDYGTYLLSLLLSENRWRTIFGSFLLRSRNEVVLDITTSDPELLFYPWEVCAHVNWEALQLPVPPNDIIVVRTPGPYQNRWPAQEPIRILVAGVSAYGMATPNFGKERKAIEEGLIAAGLQDKVHYDIKSLRETTYEKLKKGIHDFNPHVVHLVTHGEHGKHYLENSDGKPFHIPSNQLANALRAGEDSLCLFVSTACMAMQEFPEENVWGLGRLLAEFLPITIGMQLAITEEIALAFTRVFYSGLGIPNRILEAYVQARERIRNLHAGSPEWIAPVLYRGSARNEFLFSSHDINYYLANIVAEIDQKLDTLFDSNRGFDVTFDNELWKEIYNVVNKIYKTLIDGLEKGNLRGNPQQNSNIRSMKTRVRNLRALVFNICNAFATWDGRDRKLGDKISQASIDLNDLRNDLASLYEPDEE
jgi:hypothetical protein